MQPCRMSVLVGVALLFDACMSAAAPAERLLANEQGPSLSKSMNPIAQLDMQSISYVGIEPMVVAGAWVQHRGDGQEVGLATTGPAGVLRPAGMCEIDNENARALVTLLASADVPESSRDPQLGDYYFRIRAGNKIVTGRILTAEGPGIQPPPAIVIRERQLQLDVSKRETLRRLIASARC
jgi:hypothetical protein